jgi:integrase
VKGTIAQKGNRYYPVADLGRDESGRRRRQWHPGHGSEREAQQALTDILHRLDTNTYVAPSRLTVTSFLINEWLPTIRTSIRHTTWDSYSRTIALHITPHVGNLPLQALTPARINRLYSDLLDGGRLNRGGGALSPKTVRNVHVILRKSLGDAVRWGLLQRNVAEYADPPKLRAAGNIEMKTWTPDQVRAFLETTSSDRLHAAFLLAATTGMRRGEVLGLRWQDVDLDARRLAVRQTLVSVAYSMEFSTPKTQRSRRSIPLDGRTAAALQFHCKQQDRERHLFGPDYIENDLVFRMEDGRPVQPDSFSQFFEKLLRQSGLPRIRFHDLRHTYATVSLQAGVPAKVVSDRLGHATVAFTLDVYSHAVPGLQEEAADKVAALIFGSESEIP